MRRVNPKLLAALGGGILLILAAILLMGKGAGPNQDRLSDEQAAPTGKSAPESRCASQATYDRVKAELFRQAAQVRKSDQATFDRLAAYASVRVERPLLRSRDAELGTVRCSGRLSLDLPPGLSVAGGRTSLGADIDYVLQPAADGSGDVAMLEGADAIIIPLATLTRTGQAAPAPATAPPVAPDEPTAPSAGPGPAPAPTPPSVEPEPPASASAARPSFNCRYARTRGEIAVCRSPRLAELDRQMAGQYYRAIAAADGRQRALLTRTRDAFLRFRDQCPSDACIAETYRGRMREIRDIMRGTWRPER
jgi:uncharacterized protein YecT (DUF1311 family)